MGVLLWILLLYDINDDINDMIVLLGNCMRCAIQDPKRKFQGGGG